MNAPIAVFLYRRPDHTRRTLESLLRCEGIGESELHIFCDGPRTPADAKAVAEVVEIARGLAGGFATIVESPVNRGLAASIIAGVSDLCARYGRVIVVEDDLVLSPTFLSYMNGALDHYESVPRVMQVSGYMFAAPEFATRRESMLLPFTSSWGWATWQRAWQAFDANATGWAELASDASARRRFNVDGAYDYYSLLVGQVKGRRDSWAIRWYLSVFRANGLVVYPPRTLVENIGFDGSGTHGGHSGRRLGATRPDATLTFAPPPSDEFSESDYAAARRALSRLQGGPLALLKRLRRWAARNF
jgi:hypothetical protein